MRTIRYLQVGKASDVWPDSDAEVPEVDAELSSPQEILSTIIERTSCSCVREVYLQTLRPDGTARWQDVKSLSKLPEGLLKVKVVVSPGAAGLQVQMGEAIQGMLPQFGALVGETLGTFTELLTENIRKMLLSPGQITVNPSSAGSSKLQQVLLKLHKRLVRELPFADLTSNEPPFITDFDWSQGNGRENERAGYAAAMPWITKHLCPPGVRAVLKDDVYWLASQPADDVRITGGNVDVVFVMEEDASAVEAADDPTVHLLSLCGQCELKTVRDLQVNTSECFAQAAIEHIAATHLQDTYLAAAARRCGVELQSQVKFVTILTDLNDGWYVMEISLTHLEVAEKDPPRPAIQAYLQMTDQVYHKAVAVLHIKKALAEAADSIKLVKSQLFPGTTAALAPGGPASASGNDDSGNGTNGTIGGGDGHVGPNSHAGQPSSGGEPSSKTRKQGDGARERQCPPYNKEAMLQASIAFKERLLHDSDLQRDMEAGFNLAIVEFLRTPSGYKGLLGLDSPPSTFQLPSFFELLSGPERDYAAAVAAMMQATQGDNNVGQG